MVYNLTLSHFIIYILCKYYLYIYLILGYAQQFYTSDHRNAAQAIIIQDETAGSDGHHSTT